MIDQQELRAKLNKLYMLSPLHRDDFIKNIGISYPTFYYFLYKHKDIVQRPTLAKILKFVEENHV